MPRPKKTDSAEKKTPAKKTAAASKKPAARTQAAKKTKETSAAKSGSTRKAPVLSAEVATARLNEKMKELKVLRERVKVLETQLARIKKIVSK